MAETLAVLKDGGVILYPTDTVWGLGCDATNPEAVERIFKIKQREDSKSLVLLAASLDQVGLFVKEIPPMAIDLVEVNDKPMTLVYPGAITGKFHLASNAVASDGTVGIRIPMMEFCRQLCYKLGRPVVSTSANISGERGLLEPVPLRSEARGRSHGIGFTDNQARAGRSGGNNQRLISAMTG